MISRKPKTILQTYQFALFCTTFLLVALALLVNLIFDPLWFWKGNQITSINLVLNERQAKTNLLLKNAEKFDCLIFGSSRVTLLPQHQIDGYHCFNYSFSGGLVGEFIPFAKYALPRMSEIKLLIVGVDDFNFTRRLPLESVPDFILSNSRPPNIFSSYLSLDALNFSWRTLNGDSDLSRAYDSGFRALVLHDAPSYHPEPIKKKDASESYFVENTRFYQELLALFPNSKKVGYTPPVSAWKIANKYKNNELGGYLESLNKVSQVFDEFYDFSIPSLITKNTANTYDGSHYSLAVNEKIALTLSGSKPSFGVDVKKFSLEEYQNIVVSKTVNFIREISQ